MRASAIFLAAIGVLTSTPASAATFLFNTDPFAGSTALSTPGRQVVGGEPFIIFDPAVDQFAFDPAFFAVGNSVSFANDVVGNLATSGLNVIVLRTLDDDANAATAFGAGSAATLLANRITGDGAGFFIYFNSGLDLPRLVYSTNLSDPTADLKIVARMTNFAGNPSGLSGFSSRNFVFAAIPEPSSWAMMLVGFGIVGASIRRAREKAGRPALEPRFS